MLIAGIIPGLVLTGMFLIGNVLIRVYFKPSSRPISMPTWSTARSAAVRPWPCCAWCRFVLASHGPVLKDYVVGSNAGYIALHAPCSVFVVREPTA